MNSNFINAWSEMGGKSRTAYLGKTYYATDYTMFFYNRSH